MKTYPMEPSHNVVGWFEIPVEKMERAILFYETVFEFKISRNQMGPLDMGWFPWVDDSIGSGGALVYHPEYYKPSSKGVLIYFTAFSGDVSIELSRVEKAGGKVIQEKTLIAEDYGYMAIFIDTEGNRIALHSR
jgi:predicted enzyme related to lactoylglutathione lyase